MKYIAFTTMLLVLSSVAAAEMSYSYVEVGAEFGNVEIGAEEYDSTGIDGALSVGVHENVAFMLSAGFADFDVPSPLELSSSGIMFGVLGHAPATESIDVMLGAGVGRVEVEFSDGVSTISDDDTATNIFAGLRGIVTEGIEAEARVVSSDSFGERSESYGLIMRVKMNEKISGAINYGWADGYNGVGLGVRVTY